LSYLYTLYRRFCVIFNSLDPENKSFLEMGVKLNGRVYQDIAPMRIVKFTFWQKVVMILMQELLINIYQKIRFIEIIQKDFSH
jgi:hypothetical protein